MFQDENILPENEIQWLEEGFEYFFNYSIAQFIQDRIQITTERTIRIDIF